MNQLIEDPLIITLNSANGTLLNGDYKSNVLFNLPNLLKNERHIAYTNISVQCIQIPFSFYPINYSNNKLNYIYNGINYTFNITVGVYNANTMITQLQTLFLNNGQTMTVVINPSTGVLTFSSPFAFSFLSTSTCGYVLGFATTVASVSNSLTMTYPLNILGAQKIKVQSKTLLTKNIDTAGSNYLAVIPISSPPFSLITWENPLQQQPNLLLVKFINSIDILLTDENNNPLNLNGQDFNISLRLSIFRNYSNDNEMNLSEILQIVP
jgi:hypothetical protein